MPAFVKAVFLLVALVQAVVSPLAGAADWPALCRAALVEYYATGRVTAPGPGGTAARSRPLFVTLQAGRQTRGCAGTFQPRFTALAEELAYFAVNAATRDRRYPALSRGELERIAVIVTFPGELRPVDSLAEYDPWRHGLLVEKDGRSGVVLPCEGKTSDYALRKALAQAGITDSAGAEIKIFDCETFWERK